MDDPARAQTALKRQQVNKRNNILQKAIRKQMLQTAVRSLYNAKMANSGRLPYGRLDEILLGLKNGGFKVTRDVLPSK